LFTVKLVILPVTMPEPLVCRWIPADVP
jgi:hypothetical protein